jgi:branched-chain amino acid transport system substrate-binding protein
MSQEEGSLMQARVGPGRRWWRLAVLVVGALVLALGAAACGGGDDEGNDQGGAQQQETQQPAGGREGDIKIGVLTTCGGPFAFFEEASFSGAKYALVELAGAKPTGEKPRDTVSGAEAAGKSVSLAFGCSDATPDKAVAEARRLVENQHVDVLLGPLSGDEGIAVANYAKTQTDITFVNGTSGAQETTLQVKAKNFFRFGGDGAQWMAGLGGYAYNELGWRSVAILGEDYSYPYTQAAGFVAEFCSLGGQVTKRVWAPLETTDWSTFVTQLPRDVDGVLLLTGGANTVAALRAYLQLGNEIRGKVLGGSSVLDPTAFEIGDQLAGLVGGSPVPLGSDEDTWQQYTAGFAKAYPNAPAESLFTVLYYNGMKAIVQALEKTDGKLSGGQSAFRDALTGMQPEFPNGTVKLDDNRNSIQPAFVVEVVNDGGELGFAVRNKIDSVDQTFGGLFGPDSPSPGRDAPACEKGTPPPWAK